MDKQKILRIKCDLCDARKAEAEGLEGFDRVEISCDILLVSPESRKLLQSKAVSLRCDDVMEAEGDVTFSTVNGQTTLRPGPAPAARTWLTVNGQLEVEAGCQELIAGYLGMTVNGQVVCPESMSGLISSKARINGQLQSYPDGCIRLGGTAVLDQTFLLRAREKALYHANRLVAMDLGLNVDKLTEKGVRFSARQLVTAESLAEKLVPLVDEKARITILPDGCAFVPGDAVLNRALVKKYGGKLYVNGDLTVNRESEPVLDQVEGLWVRGDLRVIRPLAERVAGMQAEYGDLVETGGTVLAHMGEAMLSAGLLEQAADGVSFVGVGTIRTEPDLPAELLREKLVSVVGCGAVICTPEQAAAILPVERACGHVGPEPEQQSADPEEEGVTLIVCDQYVL